MLRWLMLLLARSLALAIALAAPSGAAQAKWLEASTSHFVIYADESVKEIEQFSGQLERFHSAMAMLLQRSETAPPSPSNRVTIYVVRNDREVRKLAGDAPRQVYAFYMPRAGGSLAIVPNVDAGTGDLEFSMIALLHEYTHHFQLTTERFAMPRWFVEGSAEFFASARFEKDGAVMLGRPALHRAGELFYAPDVTATDLLDPAAYEKRAGKRHDAFYGKSWLLYHYLTFSPERTGQFGRYLQQMREGKTSAAAALAAFGDLGRLEKDLERYVRQPRMSVIRVPPGGLPAVSVAIRELSAGEAAVMPVRIRSRRGVNAAQATELLPDAQAVAARFPQDAAVLAALAEAEYDAGHDDAAIKAADAALALDGKQVNAYVQKGYALFRKARSADDKAAAFREARAPFLALNKLENDHPLPLIYFYMSFGQQRQPPSDMAVKALERAVELAPFDLGLRAMLAFQKIRDSKYDEAIAHLTPIAYNPHGGAGTERARKMLERLQAGEKPDAAALAADGGDAEDGGESAAAGSDD